MTEGVEGIDYDIGRGQERPPTLDSTRATKGWLRRQREKFDKSTTASSFVVTTAAL
jgi:hypothetical protein